MGGLPTSRTNLFGDHSGSKKSSVAMVPAVRPCASRTLPLCLCPLQSRGQLDASITAYLNVAIIRETQMLEDPGSFSVTCTHTNVRAHIHECSCIHVCAGTHTRTHTQTRTRMRARTHKHTYTPTRKRTYKHINIDARARTQHREMHK